MSFKKLLLPVLVMCTTYCISQVCPTATFNTQYDQTTNLGGAAENPLLNPFTYMYTTGAGANRLMLLFVTYETENNNGPNNFAGATYGGVALTNVVNQTVVAAGTQQNRLAIYYLKEAGITGRVGNTVSISFTNPGGTSPNGSINGVAVNTLLFENVSQVTPLLNITSNTNTNTVTITVPASFTATAGNYVIAAVNMALATATVGPSNPSYTVYISQQVAGSHTHSVAYKSIVTTGIEQPGFTANVSTRQIIGSVEIKALTTGGSCAGALVPVKLFSFAGNMEDNAVKLIWKTENESNIARYNIQRSISPRNGFETIGNVSARNISMASYQFNDVLPLPMGFYRLQIINMDGEISYGNIIRISKGTGGDVFTLVSPFNTSINIFAASSVSQNVVISMSDITGRSIYANTVLLEKGMNSLQLPAERFFAGGLYFLTIRSGNKNQTFKIFKD